MKKLLASALLSGALFAAAPAAAVTTFTYKGMTSFTTTVGPLATPAIARATLSFTTTTQSGVIRGGDIPAFEITIDTLVSDDTLMTTFSQVNSSLLVIGNALTVTPEGIFFNFTDRAGLVDFLFVTGADAGAYYCLQTDNDCTTLAVTPPLGSSAAAEVYAPADPVEIVVPFAAPRSGNVRLASFAFATPDPGGPAGPVPEPASWAMMIGGFGLAGGALRYRRRRTLVAHAQ